MANSKKDILTDLGLFAVTAGLAWYEGWTARDLLWGLWISSLVLGYSHIIAAIGSALARGDAGVLNGGTKKAGPDLPVELQTIIMDVFLLFAAYMFFGRSGPLRFMLLITAPGLAISVLSLARRRAALLSARKAFRVVMILPACVFLLGFFTLHFGGFHLVHSMILQGFFPLIEGVEHVKFLNEQAGLSLALARTSLYEYWPFVLACALSRLSSYRSDMAEFSSASLFRPYLNVMRMHLLIFAVSLIGMAGFKKFALDAAMYIAIFVYFFPFSTIMQPLRAGKAL